MQPDPAELVRPKSLPPGPRYRAPGGALARFEADRLAFLEAMRDEYGGLVALDPVTAVVNEPSDAVAILRNGDAFVVAANFLNRRIGPDEIAATSAARRHLNADLRDTAVTEVRSSVRTLTRAWLDGSRRSRVDAVDPMPAFESLFSHVVARFYFAEEGDRIRPAVTELLDALSGVFGNPLALPTWVPTRGNRRVHRAYRELRRLVDPPVRRRTEALPAPDYAARVVRRARAAGHDTTRIANLLIGSLLAAQRVPAAAAAWSTLHLAEDPALADRTRRGDLPMTAVVLESVRLHPPTWMMQRTAARNVTVGGYQFRAGHQFLISPYIIHRDEGVYPSARTFAPERWRGPHDTQFLGFGQGLHRCPGRDLGLVMITAALIEVLATHTLGCVSRHVVPDPRTTLTPRGLAVSLTRTDPRHADEFSPVRGLATLGENRSHAD